MEPPVTSADITVNLHEHREEDVRSLRDPVALVLIPESNPREQIIKLKNTISSSITLLLKDNVFLTIHTCQL